MNRDREDRDFEFDERVAIKIYHGGMSERDAIESARREIRERAASRSKRRSRQASGD